MSSLSISNTGTIASVDQGDWDSNFALRLSYQLTGSLMDIIFIHELCIDTTIGVHPWERESRRNLLVDLELAADIRPAAATDQLDRALDYQTIAQRIRELAAASRCQLLETLAEQIAQRLLEEFAAPWLRLTLRKPGVPSSAQEAGVIIERGCRD